MLTRFRIEVEGEDSAGAAEIALAKYEHALQLAEVNRYGHAAKFQDWPIEPRERCYHSETLGREVTDEVIEYDPGYPGYKGRRVVRLKRLDTR